MICENFKIESKNSNEEPEYIFKQTINNRMDWLICKLNRWKFLDNENLIRKPIYILIVCTYVIEYHICNNRLFSNIYIMLIRFENIEWIFI